MGIGEHIRSEKHVEHLASCVLYGSMELPDAVREYMRFYQTTYSKALIVVTAAYNKIGVKHEQAQRPANPQD